MDVLYRLKSRVDWWPRLGELTGRPNDGDGGAALDRRAIAEIERLRADIKLVEGNYSACVKIQTTEAAEAAAARIAELKALVGIKEGMLRGMQISIGLITKRTEQAEAEVKRLRETLTAMAELANEDRMEAERVAARSMRERIKALISPLEGTLHHHIDALPLLEKDTS